VIQANLTRSIVLQPDAAPGYGDLGAARLAEGDVKGAAIGFLRCLRLDPSQHRAAHELGQIFLEAGHLDVAAGFLRGALVADPGRAALYSSLGACHEESGRLEEAGRDLSRAVSIDRLDPLPAMNRVMHGLYLPGVRLSQIGEMAAEVAARIDRAARPVLARSPRPDEADRVPCLGILSGDFRKHPVAHLVLPAFEGLARLGYRLTCYSTKRKTDAVTDRFKAAADWREAYELSDQALAAQIQADGIDILIDLAGFTGGHRIPVLAQKPAPLQLGWAGFPATTGLSAMDYLIADRHQVPEGVEAHYAEKILRLPHSYVAFGPPDGPDLPPLPAIRNGFVTFASFNAAKKVNDGVVAVWARLLREVPASRALLKAEAFSLAGGIGRYRDLFASFGIGMERLTFLGSTSRADHMAAMMSADIALDPFPYSGGQTTLELLWSGLPVISLPGETWASRHTAGYLTTVGLAGHLAVDAEDYIAKAKALAEDLEGLARMRSSMRQRLEASPLCDVDGFVRDLDGALRAIWQRRCLGLPAVSLRV